jgi:cytochrome c oxidase subunit 2
VLFRSVDVAVVGKQWWWEYDYLKPAAKEGAAPTVEFSTANEMHVEVGTWVRLQVTSADVIHAFWVPRVFGKRDATPGRSYPIVFKPEQPGEYIGQCAELCGASHARMGIKLFVHAKEGPNSYDKWLEKQKSVAEEPVTPSAQKGKELFLAKACNRCHTIRGDSRTEIRPSARRRETGPDLTHVGSRTTIAALAVPNTRDNLAKWIHDPASIKEAALMADPRFNKVKVSKEEAAHIAAYLHRLK